MVRRLLTACRWDKEKLLERYYAGDQEALFKEAHVIDPAKKPKPKVVVRMNSTPKVSIFHHQFHNYVVHFVVFFSQQFPVLLQPVQYKSSSVTSVY